MGKERSAFLKQLPKRMVYYPVDAVHSLGAEYKNKKVGALADLTTLSFHPVKSITTGEGGGRFLFLGNFYPTFS